MNLEDASAWSMRFIRPPFALRGRTAPASASGQTRAAGPSGLGLRPARSFPCPIQDLRNVDELDREAEALGTTFLMHDAGHVGGNDVLRAGLLMVVHLVIAHLGRDRLLEYRKRSAQSAALVGPLRRDEADTFDLAQQVQRLREERLLDLGHLGGAQRAQ